MVLKQYFRDEINFLKEEGKTFSKVYPQLANFLSDESVDPDVERLLEGFAFLSGRLRQKIDDDFPELTHSVLNLLWPNYLRPIPSSTIMQFAAKDNATTERQLLEKGTLVESVLVDGEPCQFSTCAELAIDPLEIQDVVFSNTREKAVVTLNMKVLTDQPLSSMGTDDLSIHFSGDDYNALNCYLGVFNYLDKLSFTFGDKTVNLPTSYVCKQGFAPEEALLPYPKNVFDGYRILQEFFAFPRRFYFFKLMQLQNIWPAQPFEEFNIELHFSRSMPGDMQLTSQDFSLHCTPAVNLFPHHANPINLTGEEVKYSLTPMGDLEHYEVFSVNRVVGVDTDESTRAIQGDREYFPFETFQHEVERASNRHALYYKTHIKETIDEDSFKHEISLVRGDEVDFFGKDEALSISLTCTNRHLAESLAVGDICVPSQKTPSFVTFKNITKPTPSVRPILDGSLHWTLISNFSLNYLSLLQTDLIRNVIRSYDFLAMHDIQAERRTAKRLNAIQSIQTKPIDMLFKGVPVRGVQSTMEIDETGFSCEGEVFLFGTVLAQFFGLYAGINSFHILEVINLSNNEHYQWDMQSGRQPVI